MPARYVTIGNTNRHDPGGNLMAFAPVVLTLKTPGGLDVIDTNIGGIVDRTPQKFTMDASANWSKTVLAPGDMSDPASYYEVSENGFITNSPSFVYTGTPIVVSSWIPAPVTAGMVKMRLDAELFTGAAPTANKRYRFYIAKDTMWGTQFLDSTAWVDLTLDSNNRIIFYAPPTSALADTTARYAVKTPAGSVYYFTVPNSTADPLGESIGLHISSFVVVGSTLVVGPAGSTLLAVQSYTPGADGHVDAASTAFADVDAANHAITFTAPASGNVVVRVRGIFMASDLTSNVFWGLREATTNLAGTSRVGSPSSAVEGFVWQELTFYLSGVTAGAHTYKLAFKNGASTTAQLWAGPGYGPTLYSVESAP